MSFFFPLKKKTPYKSFLNPCSQQIFFFIWEKKRLWFSRHFSFQITFLQLVSSLFPIDHFSFISNLFFSFQKINSILCTKDKLTESHKLRICFFCFNRTKKNFLSLFLVRRAPTQYNHSLLVLFFPINNKPYVCWFSKGFPLLFLIKETKELFQQ